MSSDSAICSYRVKDISDTFVYSDLLKADGSKYELSAKRDKLTRGGVSGIALLLFFQKSGTIRNCLGCPLLGEVSNTTVCIR